MRIGSMNQTESAGNVSAAGGLATGITAGGKRFRKFDMDALGAESQNYAAAAGNLLSERLGAEDEKKGNSAAGVNGGELRDNRGEAVKIYEAIRNGEENPIKNLRAVPQVPYGCLAKDGVIDYNGVVFVCDERSNSIWLGDMTDRDQVINITLSGGGHLKVNRENLGELSKAIGMFSPEDVNLILRAIHQDTKIQSMQKEMDDLEAGVGELISSGQ